MSRNCSRKRSSARTSADSLATRHREIFLRGGRACGWCRSGWARSPRTTAWKAPASIGIPLDRGFRTRRRAPGICRSAIFWIATSWLATGLYIAPAVSGTEPKGQRLGVNILFGALVLVVVGSLAGEWLSIEHKLGNLWFWFGIAGL